MDELNIRDTNFYSPFSFLIIRRIPQKIFPTMQRLFDSISISSIPLEGKIRDENLHWLES